MKRKYSFWGQRLLLFAVTAFTLFSCGKDDLKFDNFATEDMGLDWAATLPIINSRMSLSNLTNKRPDLLQFDSTGLAYLSYAVDSGLSYELKDFVKIPDQNFGFSRNGIPGVPGKDIPVGVQDVDSLSINPMRLAFGFSAAGGAIIDSVWLSAPTMLTMDIQSTVPSSAKVELSCANLITPEGLPYKQTLNIEKWVSGDPSHVSIPLGLDGYKLKFGTGDSIIFMMNGMVYKNPDLAYKYPPDTGSIAVNVSFTNFAFDACFGYFGQFAFNMADSVSIGDFPNLTVDDFGLEGTKIYMELKNSIGAPTRIYTSTVNPVGKKGPMNPAKLLPDNFDVPYPAFGEPITDTTIISVLNNVITDVPTGIAYHLSGAVNPDTVNKPRNYVTGTSKIEAAVKIDVPIYGHVSGLAFQDTVDFGMSDNKIIEKIEAIGLAVNLKNAFPFELNFQMHFMDSLHNVIYSVPLNTSTIASAKVGADGRVTDPVNTYLSTKLNADGISKLKKTKYIYFKATVSTADAANKKNVKLYQTSDTESFLDVKLGVDMAAEM